MGKQKLQDIYLKLDRSVYEEGSLSQTKASKLPTIPEEGIFVRKAQYENPLSPRKRNMIIKKSKEHKLMFMNTNGNKRTQTSVHEHNI
ncbi:hypothetical protein Hanom_Chr11g00977891 [Helianthus anomalus]